jgi:hypothetical protein
MRVIREVEARFCIGGVPTGIDAERTDLPVARNRPNHEENQDQRAREQQDSKPPAAATFLRLVG